MRTILRVSVAALAVTTALTVASCGRSDTPAAKDTAAAAVSAGKATGTIKVWAMGAEGEKLGEFAKAFTKANPDAKVEVTAIPWDAAHDKISTAIAANTGPDVSMIGTTNMAEFAAAKALDPTPTIVKDASFFPGAWGSTVVGDVSYGVPWYVETRVLYTNNAVAKKAGVSADPTSWKDLTASTAAMQKAGAASGITLQPGKQGSWQTLMPFAWQAGAELLSKDGKKITIDTPEFVAAVKYYQSFFTSGVAPKEVPEGTTETSFEAGTIASLISGPWTIGTLNDAGFTDYTVAPLPKGEKLASFIGGADLAVFKNSKNRDSAWKFVQWLSQPDTQAAWYATAKDLPAVPAAWESGDLSTDPQLKVFGTQLKTAVAPPAIPNWEQIATVIDTELEKVCKSGLDPQEAVTAMQKQAEAIGTGL